MLRHVLNDDKLKGYSVNLVGADSSDLVSELCAVLCEKNEEQLEKLKPYFDFWCVRTMRNIALSGFKGKGRMGKYHEKYIDREELLQAMSTDHREEDLKKIEEALDSLYWYDSKMLIEYLDEGSLRKLSKVTGISIVSIQKTVNDVKWKVKWSLT